MMEKRTGMHSRGGIKEFSMNQQDWEQLSPEKKKEELYLRQVRLLQTFLEHGAISQAQYDKSVHDLTEKMGMQNLASGKDGR